MILIITLNPLLERRYSNKKIVAGQINRNSDLRISAGGKGINVSRQLKVLGIKSFNFIFLGGNNGKIFIETLKSEGLEFSFIPTKSGTREAAVIISELEKKVTSYFSKDPQISVKEVDEFKEKLDKMIQNCEIVVFSGSSPSIEADSIIPYGIKLANKYDKISICDTYGRNLQECLNSSPTIIHNNFNEIENSLAISLNDEESIISFLKDLSKQKVKRAYITNGEKTFYASNFDYFYKIKPLKINAIDSTGSGDCFVAGLIYSWLQQDVFENSLKFSTALAALNAKSFDVCKVQKEDAFKLQEEVVISPIGKKIKLIDDSPHEI
jgi:1-phosphofructokinase family hexose kinase